MAEVETEPMITQCPAKRESDGSQCEAWLIYPHEPHDHFITNKTIQEHS